MKTGYFETPLGLMEAHASEKGLALLQFVKGAKPACPEINGQSFPVLRQVKDEMQAYMRGELTEFTVPLDIDYGTDFQRAAWGALCAIPYGQTRSYGAQAVSMDNPKAVRAVGMANNKNRISIIIPCHRVIGSNGSLTGYAGGLDKKEWLLKHEQSVLAA